MKLRTALFVTVFTLFGSLESAGANNDKKQVSNECLRALESYGMSPDQAQNLTNSFDVLFQSTLLDFPVELDMSLADRRAKTRDKNIELVSKFYAKGFEPTRSEVVPGTRSLAFGYTLQIRKNGFSVINGESKREIDFPGPITDVLPQATLLSTGPTKWLLSIYNPSSHQIEIYGIALSIDKLDVEYLFRVKLFAEQLGSAPYLGFGPSIMYQGGDGFLYAYLFDFVGSGDVEPLSGEIGAPLNMTAIEGQITAANFLKSGNLTYSVGGKKHRLGIFHRAKWLEYLK